MTGSDVSTAASVTLNFARWRKPFSRVIGAAFIALLVLTDSPPSPLLDLTAKISGILLIGAAVLGRIWCALYIAGRKNAELCIDGPYSICRNPLYVFSFFGAVGFAFAIGALPLGLALVPLFWGYHHFVIKAEEAHLRSLFGTAYADYCAKVPRLFPMPSLYWSRSRLTIDLHNTLRALSEVAWFLVALAIAEVIGHLRGGDLIPTIFTWPF
ncbi:MAG: isoprenylcysteine carboxylmethyltransferase family protein [Cephaloticoccus sp.]|nr:isoprenylcysteine carboxylmethyltransferase family protein [Cephaloticoccus sp.]